MTSSPRPAVALGLLGLICVLLAFGLALGDAALIPIVAVLVVAALASAGALLLSLVGFTRGGGAGQMILFGWTFFFAIASLSAAAALLLSID